MQWSDLNYPIGTLVNQWSGRNDLIAEIGPDKGGGTAFYLPRKAKIEANTDVILKGFTPRDVIRKDIAENYKKFPVAIGALYHEAMHARHSPDYSKIPEFRSLTSREYEVLTNMEEPRIEGLGVGKDRTMQPYLKASSMRIVIENFKKMIADGESVSYDNAILTLGRVSAGVIKPKTVKKIRDWLVSALTEETVERMEMLLDEFVVCGDRDYETMIRIAKEWCALVDNGEPSEEEMQALMDALMSAATDAGIEANNDIVTQERDERKRKADEKKAEAQKRKREAQDAGKDAEKASPQKAFGGHGHGGYHEVPFTTRKPTAQERRAAVMLAERLRRVEYTDKHKDAVDAEVPPGRLRIRNMIQNEGRTAAGSTEMLPEWSTIKQTVTESPTLRVGMIVDVSGSMSSAMEPMAATNFVIKTALDRIHAETATVYMGNDVYDGTVKKHAEEVQVWNANAGTEHFAGAVALLDNRINLTLQETGARLAVVASDANYHKPGAKEAAVKWLRLLRDQGVGVLWLGYGSSDAARQMCEAYGARFVRMTGRETPAEVATVVGEAAVKELQSKKIG